MKQRVVMVEEEGNSMPNGEQTEYRWVPRIREVEAVTLRIRGLPESLTTVVPVSGWVEPGP